MLEFLNCFTFLSLKITFICLIPLFHTGHKSPESPQIDFFIGGGDSWGFIKKKFSNRDALLVSPDSDTMSLRIFGRISSIWLEWHKNS